MVFRCVSTYISKKGRFDRTKFHINFTLEDIDKYEQVCYYGIVNDE